MKRRTIETKSVRKFVIPPINSNALCYQELVNVALSDEPPVTKNLSENELHNVRNQPFIFKQPSHKQVVERHIKLVSEASSKVIGFQKRDGLIRQKIKLRKLFNHFNTKKHYN